MVEFGFFAANGSVALPKIAISATPTLQCPVQAALVRHQHRRRTSSGTSIAPTDAWWVAIRT